MSSQVVIIEYGLIYDLYMIYVVSLSSHSYDSNGFILGITATNHPIDTYDSSVQKACRSQNKAQKSIGSQVSPA